VTPAVFVVLALLTVVSALTVVVHRNPVHSACALVATLFLLAVLFAGLDAPLVAVLQIIVYAGAIVVLFLFVIMLLGPSAQPPHDRKGRFARSIGGGLFALLAIGAMALVIHGGKATVLRDVAADFGSIDQMGRVLFSYGLVPFELSSALLMIAVVGAVAVARGKDIATSHRSPPLNAGSEGSPMKPESPRQAGELKPQGGH